VVVSFHSLEDRLVKRFMLGAAGRTPAPSRHDPRSLMEPLGRANHLAPLALSLRNPSGAPSLRNPLGALSLRNRAVSDFSLLTNGAERPDADEARANPRARSARLRALARHAATPDWDTAPA